MWQKAVQPYIESGDMVAIGVVQEQHPDRTRLYRQWRQLDWPIFVDATNVIDHVTVVPIPIAIDEAGMIVHSRFRPAQLDTFIKTERESLDIPADYNRVPEPDIDSLRATAERTKTAKAWLDLGRAYFDYGTEDALNHSVAALARAVELDASSGSAHFSLGAALRRRYETKYRLPTDAQTAVEHWGHALEINPNHYIWRRRIQQYGPRLDKPYNFYFWIEQARADIRARGEQPIRLAAEPMGSEIAPPAKAGVKTPRIKLKNPDPRGRINRDQKHLVAIEPLLTPARVQPGHRARVRVTFRLNESTHPLWNNEADNLMIWVGLPDGLTMVEGDFAYANPELPETRELRHVEFEVAVVESLSEQKLEFPGYALYYVCEEEGGVCYYLRNDFTVALTIDPEAPTLR